MRTNRPSTERSVTARVPMSRVPVEWLDAGSWRLPSGKALAEFALQAGFLAPLLFRGSRPLKESFEGSRSLEETAVGAPGKPLGRGGQR